MDATILIPILSGIGLLFWADQVKEEHPLLTLMFQLMYIPLIFISIHLGVAEATITYASNTELVKTLANTTTYLGYVMMIVGAYYVFQIIIKIKDIVLERRQAKHERRYGDE